MTDKTFIVNDQPTDTDALDFTPYFQTLADICLHGQYAVNHRRIRHVGIGENIPDEDEKENAFY